MKFSKPILFHINGPLVTYYIHFPLDSSSVPTAQSAVFLVDSRSANPLSALPTLIPEFLYKKIETKGPKDKRSGEMIVVLSLAPLVKGIRVQFPLMLQFGDR